MPNGKRRTGTTVEIDIVYPAYSPANLRHNTSTAKNENYANVQPDNFYPYLHGSAN